MAIDIKNALADAPFLRACRKESCAFTPVWLMRQAGRYMPEYREVREKTAFLDLCKNSQLASEVTVTAVEQLGVDAAIIFADILLPLDAMGVGLEYAKGDGPIIHRPLKQFEQLAALKPVDVENDLGYVLEAIKITRRELRPDIPLIGFAGAPFTLASYLIEGGSSRHFEKTKTLMYTEPRTWHALMEILSDVTARYLNAQIDAGAQALQLFDSWVGCLGQYDYAQYVMPYSKRTISGVAQRVPVIHFGTGTSALLEMMAEAGGDVIGIDWRIELDQGWSRVPDRAVQGNLDPLVLFADKKVIKERVKRILDQANGKPGHIFNLGHGVLPKTPVENVKYLVEIVHELSSKS
jgi:uroporphyrinogen decarboxylase